MFKLTNIIYLITLISSLILTNYYQIVDCQSRSLLHWQRDLEIRLGSYNERKDELENILASSIINKQYQNERLTINGSREVRSIGGNVRFSDLIIPNGKLILDSRLAMPTIRLMTNKTQNYVNLKMDELNQLRNQLDTINNQLNDPRQEYITKGNYLPQQHQQPLPQLNPRTIPGTWVFKQVHSGNVIEGVHVNLKLINFTSVDAILKETYMENQTFNLRDSHSRLFFEGKKTFYRSTFTKQLKSGCCDRLKPLHTNRMMTRFQNQQVLSPIIFVDQSSSPSMPHSLIIRKLTDCNVLFNRRRIEVNNRTTTTTTTQLIDENFIQLNNLISIKDYNQGKIYKSLIFKDGISINEADLAYNYQNNKLIISYLTNPNIFIDLSQNEYLMKFSNLKNNLTSMQQVSGRLLITSESHFLHSLDSEIVNSILNFQSFVQNKLIQTDRPTVIRGPIQFDALPMLHYNMQQQQQPMFNHVPIMRAGTKGLQVNQLNGMRIPDDLILLPPISTRPFYEPIVIRGSRQFRGSVKIFDFLEVNNLVNGLKMPQGVIPLHLNDAIDSLGYSNLAFVDGITAHHMTIQGGYFDELNVRTDALGAGDAQSLIMRSVFTPQPDGSQLIRAPLRIMNLRVYGSTPETGLINGFRPEQLLEFRPSNLQNELHIQGQKKFLNQVEVNDCIFQDINHIQNWTNHLIRIDRPDTVQTIYKKLAFIQPQPTPVHITNHSSSVDISRLSINFFNGNEQYHYLNNLNLSPEFYIIQQALLRATVNNTERRFRVLDQVRLMNGAKINNIDLNDIVTLDSPFQFGDKFTMVGKVEIKTQLTADRIQSNYPIDAMDLVQFDKYRIPIMGNRQKVIKLNNLVLSSNNQASFVQCKALNGIPFTEFANSIMSLTRPQFVDNKMIFNGPVNFEGFVRTESSLNGIKSFKNFANNLKQAKYSFENGLQCNSVMIKV